MAFKFACIFLLLSVVSLLAQAKHVKKEKSKQHDETMRKVREHVIYKGNTFDCDDHHTKDNFGQYCGCVFLACTGGHDCTGVAHCFIKKKNYNPLAMTGEDCGCHWDK